MACNLIITRAIISCKVLLCMLHFHPLFSVMCACVYGGQRLVGFIVGLYIDVTWTTQDLCVIHVIM